MVSGLIGLVCWWISLNGLRTDIFNVLVDYPNGLRTDIVNVLVD